jgi:hypothetical protein
LERSSNLNFARENFFSRGPGPKISEADLEVVRRTDRPQGGTRSKLFQLRVRPKISEADLTLESKLFQLRSESKISEADLTLESKLFQLRSESKISKWLGEHKLLGVVSLDEIVYDLRAVILDVLSEYNEDFQNAAECWRWLGSVGNLALERLREDVGWADYVETQGRDDYWMYPVKTKDSRLELIAGLALNLECDFPILEAIHYA